jgi:L-lactate dehydrogenase (cytochrome)
MPYADIAKQLKASAVTWDDIPWIRQAWGGAIVIKGVHNLEDARRAVECGAEAIVISNHGGRQLDRVLPTFKILQDVVPALKGEKIEILMDGGIRSGTDVLAALATGAKAVLVGRAYAYGLGAAGEAGVTKALQILRSQIEHTMRLLGRQSIAELDATCLVENPFQ